MLPEPDSTRMRPLPSPMVPSMWRRPSRRDTISKSD